MAHELEPFLLKYLRNCSALSVQSFIASAEGYFRRTGARSLVWKYLQRQGRRPTEAEIQRMLATSADVELARLAPVWKVVAPEELGACVEKEVGKVTHLSAEATIASQGWTMYWRVYFALTQIPHVFILCAYSDETATLPGLRSVITDLLNLGVVDVASDQPKRHTLGRPSALYLTKKIPYLLEEMFHQRVSDDGSSKAWGFLEACHTVLDGIGGAGATLEMPIEPDRAALRVFAQRCDRALTEVWGRSDLAERLAALGVSLEAWLSASETLDESYPDWGLGHGPCGGS